MSSETAKQEDAILLALGYDDFIDEFADFHGARTWKEFDDPMFWASTFLRIMEQESTTAFFNLQGVTNCWMEASKGQKSKTPNTAWELFQIYSHKQWWRRIRWFNGANGEARSNPFEFKGTQE